MDQSQYKWYFAFGSNMDTAQMKERGVHFRNAKKVFLRNYKLAFDYPSPRYGGAGVADIVLSPGSTVEGVLYQLSEDDLKKLDHFEGVAQGVYRRKDVAVEDQDGFRQRAICYEVIEKSDTFISPSKRYIEKLIRGAGVHYLSPSYIEKLRRIPVVEDGLK